MRCSQGDATIELFRKALHNYPSLVRFLLREKLQLQRAYATAFARLRWALHGFLAAASPSLLAEEEVVLDKMLQHPEGAHRRPPKA